MSTNTEKNTKRLKPRGSFLSVVPLAASGTLGRSGLGRGLHAAVLGNESRAWNMCSAPGTARVALGYELMSFLGGTLVGQTWAGAPGRGTEGASQGNCWMGLETTKALPQSHVPRVNHHPAMNDIPKGLRKHSQGLTRHCVMREGGSKYPHGKHVFGGKPPCYSMFLRPGVSGSHKIPGWFVLQET